ncbi:hypothetical protein SAMN05421863_10383 [Nitrosomonas communis]|uniref:Uncharacterized protein n=1 Tax=Nitrosomonas communis TaxID=44574 RepID=A0A1I4S5M4_9PROT|nr:hypothetical protein SAMN05421863_10383 [Nitrosomonas communis]
MRTYSILLLENVLLKYFLARDTMYSFRRETIRYSEVGLMISGAR